MHFASRYVSDATTCIAPSRSKRRRRTTPRNKKKHLFTVEQPIWLAALKIFEYFTLCSALEIRTYARRDHDRS